jgi:thiol-disulfide isomerase/thioredoxin
MRSAKDERFGARAFPGAFPAVFAVALAVALAGALALAGCGGGDTAGAAGDAGGRSGAPLEFTAETLDGEPFDGASLKGRPVVLWFWAPWCPTCLGQAPGVREAVERYAGKVSFVGVAGLADRADMPEFVRLAKVAAIPHLADDAGDVWKRFEVAEQSTFVLLDAAGEVTFRGKLDADEVPARVAALLG